MTKYVTIPIEGNALDATLKPRFDMGHFLRDTFTPLKIPMLKNLDDEPQYKNPQLVLDKLNKGDILLYQSPSYLWETYEQVFIKGCLDKGVKLIAYVHDLEYIRFPGGDSQYILKMYQNFNALIVSSQAIKDELQSRGITCPVVISGPWDYFIPNYQNNTPQFFKKIIYAGNLDPNKAPFLDQLSDINLDLYGWKDSNRTFNNNVNYQGAYYPEQLPLQFDGGFGLVWDGNINQSTTNNYGNYLKYNWSHKFSLYLATGLPVVVWSQANIAKFVKKYHLGIIIDSLEELSPIIKEFTLAQYTELLNNVSPIASKIRSGYFIKRDTQKALKLI